MSDTRYESDLANRPPVVKPSFTLHCRMSRKKIRSPGIIQYRVNTLFWFRRREAAPQDP
jgi:hypothetical protein